MANSVDSDYTNPLGAIEVKNVCIDLYVQKLKITLMMFF